MRLPIDSFVRLSPRHLILLAQDDLVRKLLLALCIGLKLRLTELHGQFALRTLLLLNNGRRILSRLLSMLEIVAAAPSWLPLHEVILSSHALAHGAPCCGLFRTENHSAPVCVDDSWELPSVECAAVDQVKLGASRAFPALVLGLRHVRGCRLLRCCRLLLGRADTLVHDQIVLIDVQRYALHVRRDRATSDVSSVLCGRLLGHYGVVLLLVGQLLFEPIVSAHTKMPI